MGNFYRRADFKILAGFLLAVCFLGIITLLVFRNKGRATDTSNLIHHSKNVVYYSEELLSIAFTIQDGARGYALTGQENFLATINAAAQHIPEYLGELKSLTTNSAIQREQVERLGQLIALKQKIADSTIRLRNQGGIKAAAALVGSGKGTRVMNEISSVIRQIQNEENAYLEKNEKLSSKVVNATYTWFIIMVLLVAIALLVVQYIIRMSLAARLKAESSLLENKEMLQSMLDNSASVIYTKTIEGRYILINHKFESFFKITNEAIAGKTDRDIFNVELANRFRKADEEVIRTGKLLQIEEEVPHKDGTHYFYSLKYPLFDKNRNIYATAGISFDITERKNLEEEVLKTQRFLNSIVENIPNMIFVKEAGELRFIRFNKAGEELLGLNRDELIGKNDYDFFPKSQADFFTSRDREVLESGTLMDIPEENIDTKNLGRRILHTRKIPILGKDGQPEYLLGISDDITEQKKADNELKKRSTELTRSNTELEQFAYIASHDLREPLRTVSAFLKLLGRQYKDKLDDQANEYINFAVDGAERMERLIQGLLAYSRVSTQAKAPKPTDLATVIETVLKNLHEAILQNKAEIVMDNKLPVIKGDELQMMQLFQNLISNALKFKGDEVPQIHIGCLDEQGKLVMYVKDNGIGIPDGGKERIFQIFQRLHSNEEYEGTGIGLAVVKKIVERHGGKIWVESEPGEGAEFKFTLAQ